MTVSKAVKHNKAYKMKLVVAGFIALSLSTGILINSVGQFILPIHDDMGYSVGSISLAFSIIWGAVIFSATSVAKFIDRYSPRACMAITTSVLAVMTLCISFTNQLWQFYVCTLIMGLVYTGLHTLPVSVMINEAFSNKKAIATSIAFAGTGIGGMVFNPFFNYVVGTFGWRMGFVTMAVIYFFGGLIIVWLVKVPKEPIDKAEYMEIEVSESYPIDPGEVADSTDGMSYKDAVRSKKFILFVVGILISCGTGSSTMMHSVPYMIDVGISPARASFMISVFLLMLALSKIAMGVILDKLGAEKGTLLGYVLFILAIASLPLLQISPMYYIIILAIGGVGMSTATVATPILISYLFGNPDFTRILGATIVFNGIGNMLFPFLMGLIFDLTGSYMIGWIMLDALLVVALVCYIVNFREHSGFGSK